MPSQSADKISIGNKQFLCIEEEFNMAINNVGMQTAAYETTQSFKSTKKIKNEQAKSSAAVQNADKKSSTLKETNQKENVQDEYIQSEKTTTDTTKQIYKRDTATVERLKQDAALRKQQLIELVQKTLNKQGSTFQTLSDMFNAIKDGKLNVDPKEIEQAKKDVAEDGYWGVKQTSDRLVEMAKALSGGDASKADEMIAAIEKGYKQATAAWGDELPDICKDTLAAAKEKLTQWKEDMTKTAN